MFLTLFQFLTPLPTTEHLKLFSTYLVGQNGAMWKTCFELLKMRKNKISWNIKTKCITDFFWQLGLREWRIILVITRWAHNSQTFILISKKNNENLEIFLHWNGYVNTKKSFPNCMFVLVISWKICESYIFHFFTSFLTSTH